jgi:tetratricopeptide (TPR) repeat protein
MKIRSCLIIVFCALAFTGGVFCADRASLLKDLSATKNRSKQYDILISLGGANLKEDQFTSAIEYFQRAKGLYPKREQAYMNLAAAYQQSELYELAKQEYITLLKYHKRSFEANLELGLVYLRLGINSKALEYFRNALTLRRAAEVYRDIAACEENLGDTGLALAMLKQVIPVDRNYEDLINLGKLSEKQKKPREAEEFYSNSISLDPGKNEGYIYLGLFYLAQGNITAAAKLLEIAAEKTPDEAVIHFLLADIYAKQKNIVLARQEIKRSASLAKTQMLKEYSEKFEKLITEEP